MSLVDLYALEAKLKQTKQEYTDLMRTLNSSCLGENKSTQDCQKAAELNAQMQTYLIQMSNILVSLGSSSNKGSQVLEQQRQLLALADSLEEDKYILQTNSALKEDTLVLANMNSSHGLVWGICALLAFSLIVHQLKKI